MSVNDYQQNKRPLLPLDGNGDSIPYTRPIATVGAEATANTVSISVTTSNWGSGVEVPSSGIKAKLVRLVVLTGGSPTYVKFGVNGTAPTGAATTGMYIPVDRPEIFSFEDVSWVYAMSTGSTSTLYITKMV